MDKPERILERWKGKTLSECIKIVARDVQYLVRISAADADGLCQCVTCGKVDSFKAMDAGHFASRSSLSTIFDTTNIHPQCKRCNSYLHGNTGTYVLYMDEEYGYNHMIDLLRRSQDDHDWTKESLAELRHQTKLAIKKEKERLGLG